MSENNKYESSKIFCNFCKKEIEIEFMYEDSIYKKTENGIELVEEKGKIIGSLSYPIQTVMIQKDNINQNITEDWFNLIKNPLNFCSIDCIDSTIKILDNLKLSEKMRILKNSEF